MVEFECRGKYKVFGKYVWHKVDAATIKKAKLAYYGTIAPASRTFKKYDKIVCRRRRR